MVMPIPTRKAVLWNAHAGSIAHARELEQQLRENSEIGLYSTASGRTLDQLIEQAFADGFQCLIAAGGDGTASTVSGRVYAHQKSDPQFEFSFGILPLGSGNDFARTLNSPLESMAAWKAIERGGLIDCDLLQLEVDGQSRVVLNMFTAGNTGKYLENLTEEIKARWGPLCYLRGVVDVVANLQVYEGQIEIDGQKIEGESWLNLFVANGKYSGGGQEVAANATPFDGTLNLLAIADGPPTELVLLPASYFRGEVPEHPLIHTSRGKSVTINSQEPWPCTADGESFKASLIHIRVIERALKIIQPQPQSLPSGASSSAITSGAEMSQHTGKTISSHP